jgi:transposase
MKKSKRESQTGRGKKKKITQFEILRPNVAGIDVSDNGGMEVAYPDSPTEIAIEEFGCYTQDLRALSSRLKSKGIVSVALESTGVYWIPLFLLLQEEGFEVYLVNSRHVKNVTGRKDDEGDAEWIQKLHRCGLLSASFQPDNQTRSLRSVVRHRNSIIKTRSTYLNRMQMALEQMNIKLHTIISDIDGKTGLDIIEAIIKGERDAETLADLRNSRIKASREEIVKSLEATWSEEHLFELEQCYEFYRFHNKMIMECDKKIEVLLQESVKRKNNGVRLKNGKKKAAPESKSKTSGKKSRCKGTISVFITDYLIELNGIDATTIPGISELSALSIYSEVGADMSRWKNEKHFTSWLGLAPNTKISGGQIISSHVPKKKHYAGQAFRTAAMSLIGNKGPLGDYFRRIRAVAGPKKAIVALARKLAVIYYKMVVGKQCFDPKYLLEYQEKNKQRIVNKLEKRLERLKNAA